MIADNKIGRPSQSNVTYHLHTSSDFERTYTGQTREHKFQFSKLWGYSRDLVEALTRHNQ